MSDYCTLFSQTSDGLLFSYLTITDVTWYVHHKFPVSFLLYIVTKKTLLLTVLRMFLSQKITLARFACLCFTILFVSLLTEKIDKDFTQSYWLALQFLPTKKDKPSRIFTVVCHRHPTEKLCKYANELTDDVIHSTQYYLKYINTAILANL